MSYKKDCKSFVSEEEAKKIFPKFVGRNICRHEKGKIKFIDNDNKCPPDCEFYFQEADAKKNSIVTY